MNTLSKFKVFDDLPGYGRYGQSENISPHICSLPFFGNSHDIELKSLKKKQSKESIQQTQTT